jgi:3-dehydroquinate dehydratase-2
MRRILLLHGPNLNLLGTREPEIYGRTTLADINLAMQTAAGQVDAEVRPFQSNSEGALIDALHESRTWADGIIINAGAFTHYSYALVDAISAVGKPTIEVHISNIHARKETWRHVSLISPVATASVMGFGWRGYLLALDGLLKVLGDKS